MRKMIYSTVGAIGLALSAPASAQTVVVEEDTVQVAPTSDYYAPGTLQYYNAVRPLDDDDNQSRTADQISPNETDHFYQQMEREGRAGSTQ